MRRFWCPFYWTFFSTLLSFIILIILSRLVKVYLLFLPKPSLSVSIFCFSAGITCPSVKWQFWGHCNGECCFFSCVVGRAQSFGTRAVLFIACMLMMMLLSDGHIPGRAWSLVFHVLERKQSFWNENNHFSEYFINICRVQVLRISGEAL